LAEGNSEKIKAGTEKTGGNVALRGRKQTKGGGTTILKKNAGDGEEII